MANAGQREVSQTAGETLIGAVLAGLGLWWAFTAYQLGLVQYGEIGPGAFPFGVGLLLAFGGVGCAWRAIARRRAAGGKSPTVVLQGSALRLFFLTVAFGLLFALVSPLLATALFVGVMLVWLGRLSLARASAVAMVISVVLFVVFDRLLGVQLPSDLLLELINP